MSNLKYVRYIGIDFGTSTSVMSYMDYEVQESGELKALYLEPFPVKLEGGYITIPTAVQIPGKQWNPLKKEYSELKSMSFGWDAVSRLNSYPELVKQNFKMNLISENDSKRKEARELLAVFFKKLYEIYKSQKEFGIGNKLIEEHTVLSCPARWDEEACSLMIQAASKAGFQNVYAVDEAIAVMKYCITTDAEKMKEFRNHGIFEEGNPLNILFIDMGAGSTDSAIFKYTPKGRCVGEAEVIAVYPSTGDTVTFGGGDIDEIITKYIQEYLEKNLYKQPFPHEKLKDICRVWKEKVVSPELRKNTRVDEFPSELTYVINCLIREDAERFQGINRAEFEELLDGYLQIFPDMLNKVIEKASLKGEDVDMVITTGGHSQWYFVNDILLGKQVPEFVYMKKIIEEPWRIVSIPYQQQIVSQGLSMDGKHLDVKKKEVTIKINVQREIKKGKKQSLSKEPIFCTKAHEKNITAMAFSGNGKLLATGAGDHFVKVWDISNKTEVCKLDTGSYNPPFKILFLQDDRYVLAHLYNDSKIWKISDGTFSLNKTVGLAGHLGYTTYSPVLNSIVYHSADKVKFYSLPDYIKIKEISVPVSWLSSLSGIAVSSDGSYLIAAVDKEIRVYGTVTGSLINIWRHNLDSIRSMSVYGNELVYVDLNGKIKKWLLPGGKEIGEYKGGGVLQKASISPSLRYCAMSYEGGTSLELIRLSDMKLLDGTEHIKNVCGMAFSTDEKYLATGHRDGGFNVWSIGEGYR